MKCEDFNIELCYLCKPKSIHGKNTLYAFGIYWNCVLDYSNIYFRQSKDIKKDLVNIINGNYKDIKYYDDIHSLLVLKLNYNVYYELYKKLLVLK